MNVNKSHKKSPPKNPKPKAAVKPIERVATRDLVRSLKEDIKSAIEPFEAELDLPKPKAKKK